MVEVSLTVSIAHRVILLLVLAVQGARAGDPARLTPRILYPGEDLTARTWIWAPHTVAVRIVNVELLGPEVEAVAPRAVVLRLVRVTAKVENVIGGTPLPESISFYFFTNVTTIGNGAYRYILHLGANSGHIVFLREEAGLLRTIVDVNEPDLEYHTGKHLQADLPLYPPSQQTSGKWVEHPAGDALAYIMLTPGEGSDNAAFAKTLPLAVSSLFHFARTGYVVELLRRLQHNREAGIQRAACDELVRQYMLDDACIEQLQRSSDQSSRELGAALAKRAKADEMRVIQGLEERPLEFADGYSDFGDFKVALSRFAADRRPKVRERACQILRVVYRTDEFPDCRPVRQ